MPVLMPAGIGVILIPILFFLLRGRFPTAGRQIAFILGVLALAAYAPFAILHWPGIDVVAMVSAVLVMTAFILGLISPPRNAAAEKMTFHAGPATIIAFFAVIILLNSIFLTLATNGLSAGAAKQLLPEPQGGPVATSFFPGTVAHDFQEKYSEFRAYDQALEEQSRRGWQVGRGWVDDPVAGKETPFRVEVRDAEGEPVADAEVTASFMRPASDRLDFDQVLTEVGPGLYQAMVEPSHPGRWEVMVDITRGEATHTLRGWTDVADR
ncbi:MAG: FixH family protein [Guyparkeria sp.]